MRFRPRAKTKFGRQVIAIVLAVREEWVVHVGSRSRGSEQDRKENEE